MDCERIGKAAGAIWTHLHDADEPRTIAALKKIAGYTGDEIIAGLGWLAREGKVDFQVQGKKISVSLSQAELLF